MGNLEHALSAYENALRHNPMSLSGLTQVAGIARIKENYPKVSFSPYLDSTFFSSQFSHGKSSATFSPWLLDLRSGVCSSRVLTSPH